MKKRVHVWIEGRVQGVFFRANTKKKADRAGISGWVRNLSDGRVEAVLEGDKEKVSDVLEWMRRGPRLASVEDVKAREEGFKGEFNDFLIKR